MFQKVGEADFIRGEHRMLDFWSRAEIFPKLRRRNSGGPTFSFFDGPMTANNPMGVHHAWGRTYKDLYQRYWAMNGRDLRYQNGFDCQGLWVEVEVEKQLGLGAKSQIESYGIDRFVQECKKRVLRYAAIQTQQSIRLGYWMDWDDPAQLLRLSDQLGSTAPMTITVPSGRQVTGTAEELVAGLGDPDWGGSYFTFSTENNETIWTFLKKCFNRGKVYRGYDVMPWSGRGGSAYSQMEVADGRKLTVHRAAFVRFPLKDRANHFLLVWTTTPWTLTSNVAAAINPDLEYVELAAKRDGAHYYFAKDNLEFQRLAREFKEGFGRPEWQWPKSAPKLKTLSQIFKESGGYEIVRTLKGAEMVGWEYSGPFDHLPAQHAAGGVPEVGELRHLSGVTCHRVIDGGRDFKGNPNVVAGEGTGIVHIAPGCGDIDFQLGQAAGVVGIAPLDEDGRFLPAFGEFTGKAAVATETIDLILSSLKERQLLVNVEQYPHIYPHCWRTGDELVFRLVDEWFINMDWRQEIIDVTRQIDWIPASIQGQERELEWLTNMRDWMVSKKRFWGLALPIWIEEYEADGKRQLDVEVIGSLAELKERAVEGWDQLAGHSPHRPWIDAVKIRNPKTGRLMHRIPDVGNPWLDAGIIGFSTLGYRTHPELWRRWYPADFVTECFPGQFRNWFYALLSMSTMMDGTPPFKTLLGYRLVMNQQGKPMHKSDGTAIWFEEAAEQLGVDTMRWMYLQQNPANDLRFGTRHPEEPVTIETPEGPSSTTIDGVPTCRVTSDPADEVRRRVLIPLWNSYAFFINYARLDGFDPSQPAVPIADRPEIDRWILSNLQDVITSMRTAIERYDAESACRAAASLIDDLSNWYIRRNRRRFWRSRDTGDLDKLAAYQTLYQVLVTATQLFAPMIPFLAERMYQNLVFGGEPGTSDRREVAGQPESVHLCAYPTADPSLLDAALNERMGLAQQVVRLGHQLREQADQRVRQPLAELRFVASSAEHAAGIMRLADVIADELNIKQLSPAASLADIVTVTQRANIKTLGPRYGKLLGALRERIPQLSPAEIATLRGGQSLTLTLADQQVTLEPADVEFQSNEAPGWVTVEERGLQLALATALSPELIAEGIARDFVRQVQQLRKDRNLEIEAKIRLEYCASDAGVISAVEAWTGYITGETLAESLTRVTNAAADAVEVLVGDVKIQLSLTVV